MLEYNDRYNGNIVNRFDWIDISVLVTDGTQIILQLVLSRTLLVPNFLRTDDFTRQWEISASNGYFYIKFDCIFTFFFSYNVII